MIASKDNNEILIRIDERQKEMATELKEIKKKLFGNGHEGICIEVAEMKNTLQNVKYGMAIGFTIVTIIVGVLNFFKI